MSELYETDFHAWAEAQADALRRRSANEIDWENLLDEVESLAKRERRGIVNRLAVLQTHLLKWRHQPDQRTESGVFTVRTQRRDIEELLEENPSLRPQANEMLLKSYPKAKRTAAYEMGLGFIEDDLPPQPPWDFDEAMTTPVELEAIS